MDLSQIEQQQRDYEDQKRKAGLIGAIGNAFANQTSFGDAYLGRNVDKVDLRKDLESQIQDPMERQKKLLEAYQGAKAMQRAQSMSNPESAESKTAQDILRSVDPKLAERLRGASAEQIDAAFSNPLLKEKMKAQIEYQNDVGKLREANRLKMSEMAAERAAGKQLPPDKVLAVQEGKNLPRMIDDVRSTLAANSDSFGPIAGRLGAMNPYNEKMQTVDAQFRTASQSFGRYMEGGVLRKEDEEKYRKMFPQASDTPEVAKNKLDLVDRMLKQKISSDVRALKDSGYNTQGVDSDLGLVPEVPAALAAGKSGLSENTAHAADIDPVIADYAKQHQLDYGKAERILKSRGYGAK